MKQTTLGEARKLFGKPERVVWAVAKYQDNVSICPLGWKMNTSGSPPMMAISVAPPRFTHGLISKSGQCVLAWPGEDLAEATLLCGTKSGRDIDKFKEAKLTPLKGRHVDAPLVKECIANLECVVIGEMRSGDHTIFAIEILQAWVNENPKRVLCTVNDASGYDFLLQQGGYRFGVVKG
ncbi:MAG: flavin reductase family protein [Kiritimatiellae bacterium]|nr:flavin reductase family protein [Kiritimatiellia bacterium]